MSSILSDSSKVVCVVPLSTIKILPDLKIAIKGLRMTLLNKSINVKANKLAIIGKMTKNKLFDCGLLFSGLKVSFFSGLYRINNS